MSVRKYNPNPTAHSSTLSKKIIVFLSKAITISVIATILLTILFPFEKNIVNILAIFGGVFLLVSEGIKAIKEV
jgi:uncharacterized protein YhhL (DUF1145 family)